MAEIKRCFRRRFGKAYKSRTRTKSAVIALVIIFVLSMIGLYIHFEIEAASFMETYSVIKAKQMMSELFGSTVEKKTSELGLSYDELTDITYSQTGEVQAVNTDVYSANLLKHAVNSEIAGKLDSEYEYMVEIPVGSLMDSEFLSGTGIKLHFNNTVTGDVRTDFRSEFESGGINQTVHRLYIDITGELIVIAGGRQEPVSFTDSILLGETVIVGAVPYSRY